ncbi:C13 family peptidase [uncultured Erythrobacter sp.]|uniref:C13 family peptidase n=1 Tax=uncultured Erythrobacter sp. TaxID=263913 RepID=UPI00262D40D4|nr:C13 family peptidase [uncultured Erythrobacter sp.]
MHIKALLGSALCALLAHPLAAQDDSNRPPEHTEPFPNIGTGQTREEIADSFDLAPQLRRGVPARELLEQRRRLASALDDLAPQRPGIVDAYVVTIALDSDPVFAREAREAGRVLSKRYDGAGRTLSLAGPDGERDDLPRGSIESLLVSLAHIAEVMDPDEDVLVLYTTSHGLKLGLAYHYGDTGYGIFSPARLKDTLEELGIERRILILSACFSGVFVPELASPDTAILTAAASERSSFGCQPENDWTFYGDALINRAMRQPQSLSEAAHEASLTVADWESRQRLLASLPQSAIGANVANWLPQLEARMPSVASASVGRPAVGE